MNFGRAWAGYGCRKCFESAVKREIRRSFDSWMNTSVVLFKCNQNSSCFVGSASSGQGDLEISLPPLPSLSSYVQFELSHNGSHDTRLQTRRKRISLRRKRHCSRILCRQHLTILCRQHVIMHVNIALLTRILSVPLARFVFFLSEPAASPRSYFKQAASPFAARWLSSITAALTPKPRAHEPRRSASDDRYFPEGQDPPR